MGDRDLSAWRKDFLGLGNDDKNVSDFVVKYVIKRDGQLEFYNKRKIYDAINRAAVATGINDEKLINHLTDCVEEKLKEFMKTRHENSAPAIEEIQDIVETVLIEERQVKLAKKLHYLS